MARAKFVKKARKDNPVCKKGESYYWWKFRYGSKHYSLTPPKQSQLTQSEFLSTIYEIGERIEELTTKDNFEAEVEEIKSDLENLQSECEERRENMPEQLQDAPTGELLQGRYDSIDEMISELDGIELEIDESSDLEKEKDETDEDFSGRLEEELEEKKQSILDAIQEVCYNGE